MSNLSFMCICILCCGDQIFGMFRKGGEDVKVLVELSFMEAVQGCTKTLSILTNLACDTCGGSGVPPGTRPETCKRCRGSGMVTSEQGPYMVFQSTCPNCGGAGKIVSGLSEWFEGTLDNNIGELVKQINLLLATEFLQVLQGTAGSQRAQNSEVECHGRGVDNNETIKIPRSGGADPDGNQPGDLYMMIKVREDPVFHREGSDIHVDAVLSISQAILGGTIQVPTLSGDVVVKVRPGTQPGQKVVLKKRVVEDKRLESRRETLFPMETNLFISMSAFPRNMTERQRQLIEEFAREEQGEDDRWAAASATG
ncbi:hypothetical protein OROMI_017855 [Orobanche minor]